ncbi:MAG TPA: hypothetical protein VFX76_18375 [Roseiflexaceae bacterium]|nr:hypothetical protein [Roseiflexaceae bacterium]
MTRKRIAVALTLLVFGAGTLHHSLTSQSYVGYAAPAAQLVEVQGNTAPDSLAVRTLGLTTRTGMELLDARAEVVFDN